MEFQTKKKDKLSVGIHAENEKKSQAKFIGSINIKKGQKCFEMNTRNGMIELAKFETQTISYPINGEVAKVRNKLIVKMDCIYVVAINLLNAKKKFQKILNESLKDKVQTASVNCLVCSAEKSIDIDSVIINEELTASITICRSCGHAPKISDYIK